jgi:long-chain acyl-CoA synthetase
VAVLSRGRPTTYGVLRRQVGGLRAGLTELGLCPGDRVAIIASNNRYFVVGYLAVVGAGMVAVPIDPTTPALAVKEELDAVQARALIAGPSARALVTANTEGAARRRRVRHRVRVHPGGRHHLREADRV